MVITLAQRDDIFMTCEHHLVNEAQINMNKLPTIHFNDHNDAIN